MNKPSVGDRWVEGSVGWDVWRDEIGDDRERHYRAVARVVYSMTPLYVSHHVPFVMSRQRRLSPCSRHYLAGDMLFA